MTKHNISIIAYVCSFGVIAHAYGLLMLIGRQFMQSNYLVLILDQSPLCNLFCSPFACS